MKAFTVALIGADGSGKTTVGRALERALPIPVKYLYMGTNDALLPTTRLIRSLNRRRGFDASGLPPGAVEKPAPRGGLRRALREPLSLLGMGNRFAEEWLRQGLAWYHTRCGTIVVFDRHFYIDYYDYDVAPVAGRSWVRTFHGGMLRHIYPKPDLVVLLDAPPQVLWERKPEGTLDALARRREEYLRLRDRIGPFVVVDASAGVDQVVQQVARLILERHEAETRRRRGME